MASTQAKAFRADRFLAGLTGVIGGLIFLPPSVVWPLSVLRGASITDGADVLGIVTGVGWTGLWLVLRFAFGPRLVLTDTELHEHRFFFSSTIPLSAVTSIDRVEGRTTSGGRPSRDDTLYLFRGHPRKPWVLDLVVVERPEQFIAALRAQCPVAFGRYTPQTAPPWARG